MDRGNKSKRELAYHGNQLWEWKKARSFCLVISYEFANHGAFAREGNNQDLAKLREFFSSCRDCYFRSISPSAVDMRSWKTLSADGIKQIFQTDDPPTMFFLFILSHGSEQGIIWTDTKIGDVFDRFTNDDVLMALKENIFLKNTFKLIFFGPCRGENVEMRSVPGQGFLQQNTTANKYATRVESLPEEDNFAIFYSSVESTKSVRLKDGTVMVDSFILTMNNISGETNIIDLMTKLTKAISKSYSQMPQFTVFPHLETVFCKWMQQSHDSKGKLVDYFNLTNEIDCNLFRRALIFRDRASDAIAATYEASLTSLGFQVHSQNIDHLMPTATNISRRGMMNEEAWLLMFVFAAIKQVSVDGCSEEIAVATSTGGHLQPIGDIVGLFTGAQCSTYAEKPKIFFFLDESSPTFDGLTTFVHTQSDIKYDINNHSGILICSSADGDLIQNLPKKLEQMIDKEFSLQQVIFRLMTIGKKRHLSRLWSTSPDDICILKKKYCPVHPTVIHEGVTMTLAAVVEKVKTLSERLIVVAAASEKEKNAASAELYSQLVIEHHSHVILHLNTSDLNKTEAQCQRIKIVRSMCKSNAEAKTKESILVVVEYSDEKEARDFLGHFLTFLIHCECKALIVIAADEQGGIIKLEENLADLNILIRDILQKNAEEILEKELQDEKSILDKKNPTMFDGCDYGCINFTLRGDLITKIENIPPGACIQEMSSTNENLLFAKFLSNSIPGLCFFILYEFNEVEIGVREKWLNRNPDMTIVFIAEENEEIGQNINLNCFKWFMLKTCASQKTSDLAEELKISILDELSLQALNEHKIWFYGALTSLSSIVSAVFLKEEKMTDLLNLQFKTTETRENLTTNFFIDQKIYSDRKKFPQNLKEFAADIVNDDKTSTFLISTETGMGKTKFASELQKRLNEILDDHWIINLSLNTRYKELNDLDSKKLKMANDHDFETFIFHQMEIHSPLQRKILAEKLSSRKVVILLDAFDELCPDYRNVVLEIIYIVLKMQLKLVITTRPREEDQIQDALKSKGLRLFKLGLLQPSQQVDFIAKCWRQRDKTLTDFEECQFKALRMLPKANVAFVTLRTPLLLKLLADAVLPSQENAVVPEDLYEWHVNNYFKKLVEEVYEISPHKPATRKDFQKKLETISQTHRKAAGCALLEKGKCDILDEDEILMINACGLAVVNQDFIHFHHNTFAEFLLSRALVSFFQNGSIASSGMSDKAMRHILIADEHIGIRQFIEKKISTISDYPLAIENSLNQAEAQSLFKTVLCENLPTLYKVFARMLNSIDVNKGIKIDRKTFSPLTLAIRYSEKSVAIDLMKKGAKLDDMEEADIDNDQFNWFMHKAAKKGLANFVEQNIKYYDIKQLNATDDDGKTPLEYANENRDAEMIKILINHGAMFTSSTKFIHGVIEKEKTGLNISGFSSTSSDFHLMTSNGEGFIQITTNYSDENVCKDITVLEKECNVQIMCHEYCSKQKNLAHAHLLDSLIDFVLSKPTGKNIVKPIFLNAAAIGHVSVMEYMVRRGQDVNETSDFLQTALHAAARAKKFFAVKFILDDTSQAIIDAKDAFGNTPLHCAVISKADDIVQLLLEKGADVNCQNKHKNTPLLLATKEGLCELQYKLITFGANVNAKNDEEFTCLAHTVNKGLVCATKVLLSQGADPHIRLADGESCLHRATYYGHLEIVDILLQYLPIDVKTKDLWTPLLIACIRGHLDIVNLLLDKGADPMSLNLGGNSCLHLASFNGNMNLMRLFVDIIPINSLNFQRKTPLALACCNGNLEVINYLLKKGADPQILDQNECSCLHRAAGLGKLEVVQKLIPLVPLELQSKLGLTALLHAALMGEVEVVKCLIEHGADYLFSTEEEAANALHIAAARGHIEVVKFLALLIPIDQLEIKGWTALMLAVQLNNEDVVDYLLTNGADGQIIHVEAGTCLHIAASNGHLDLVRVFSSQISINIQDFNDGHTPLMKAIAKGYLQVIHLLLAKGADPSLAAMDGVTCLHYAAGANEHHMDILKVFIPLIPVNVTCNQGWTPLMVATDAGKMDAIQLLLEAGADANAKDVMDKTCLHIAAKESNFQFVKFFSDLIPLDSVTINGNTPLAIACAVGDVESVKYLLDKGADVSFCDKDGGTLLHIAIHFLEVVRVIGDLIPVDSRNVQDETPLMGACVCNAVETAKYLVEIGADVNILVMGGASYLHMAAEAGNLDLVKFFCGHLPLDCITDSYKSTPLMVATEQGRVDVVEYFVENGADLTLLNDLGFSSLGIASYMGHIECVKLIAAVSPINIANQNKATPLMLAVKEGYIEIIQYLLDKGADIAVVDDIGNSCLHYAVLSQQLAIVQLISPFISLNSVNEVGLTCLDVASLMSEQEIIDFLRDQGAARNNSCNTLRELMQAPDKEVISFVLDFSICVVDDDDIEMTTAILTMLSEWEIN